MRYVLLFVVMTIGCVGGLSMNEADDLGRDGQHFALRSDLAKSLDGCCVEPSGILDCRGPNDAGDFPAHPVGTICYSRD